MAFEILDGPRVESRLGRPTVGIRVVTPFRGMLAVRDELIAELTGWLAERRVDPGGPFFLRLHAVDMSGDMDIEVGVLDTSLGHSQPEERIAAEGRVVPGSAPAGDYALLAYRGSSMQANKTLLGWAPEEGRRFDAAPAGGEWAGRFEILRTDPRSEPRKTRWVVELAFLLLQDAG